MRPKNIRKIVNEEIALEGLDGITFQALWLRISQRIHLEQPFAHSFKQYIWEICRRSPYLTFFVLPEPRPDLIIFNRLNYKEGNVIPDDIYPHAPVEDQRKKVRGSCSTYQERENITKVARKSRSFQAIYNLWGSRLIVVASQQIREESLSGKKGRLTNFTTVRYCLLERVGRSRNHGEISHGKNSLSALREDPKTLFYHRKAMLQMKLITKQTYHQRSATSSFTGTLLHLRRYYVEQKPKYLRMTELVVDFLKRKENHRALYDEIKLLGNPNCLKKLFKTPEFQKFVHTDLRVPYRLIYPNATIKEWKMKGGDREKWLRCMQLIDPTNTVRESWPSKRDDSQDDDRVTYLDFKRLLLFVPLITQANSVIKKFGGEGCSQSELGVYLGAPRLMARSMTRNLIRSGIVCAFMNDVGRQRVTRFCNREFQETSVLAVKFKIERDRAINLMFNLNDKACDVSDSVRDYELSEWETVPSSQDSCSSLPSNEEVLVIPSTSTSNIHSESNEKTPTDSDDEITMNDPDSDMTCNNQDLLRSCTAENLSESVVSEDRSIPQEGENSSTFETIYLTDARQIKQEIEQQ